MNKLKIGKLLIIWTIISAVIVSFMFISTNKVNSAIKEQQEIIDRGIISLELASKLQQGSDILTYSVWRFVATGNTSYAQDYIFESSTTRSRDNALNELCKLDLSEGTLSSARKAKELSDGLLEKEMYSMKLIYEGRHIRSVPAEISKIKLSKKDEVLSDKQKLKKAHDFVFGLEYKQIKQDILTQINQFNLSLSESITNNINSAAIDIDKATTMQIISEIVLFVWWLVLLYMLYEFLVKPIRAYSQGIEGSINGNSDSRLLPMGAYETSYLAGAYNHLLEELKEKDRILAQQNKELSEKSKIDFLTKVSTRMELEKYLLELFEKYNETKEHFSIIMLDLDHFKEFNDTYGHPMGDEALRKLADTLNKSLVSAKGMAARMGGEEFIVALPGAEEAECRKYAKNLLKAINNLKVKTENGEIVHISASLGSYTYTGITASMKDIYVRADRALYQAKKNGRSCYISFSEIENEE